jgi:hypothetical protein
MATITVHVEGLADALGLPFRFREWLDDNAAELSTDHPASSRGMPVLVRGGTAYGPADLPGVTIMLGHAELSGGRFIDSARAAGWAVRVLDKLGSTP